jgi:biopolymer transport protein ExbD
MRRSTLLWLAMLVILSVSGVVAGCGQATQPEPQSTASGEILPVHITAAGVITANGRQVSIEELKKELARLSGSGGSILYTRDTPNGDPHPNAMKVLAAVVDANVPLLMPEK